MLLVTPRIGVVIPTHGKVAFWLRGGINYYSLSATQESDDPSFDLKTETEETGSALSLDPMLVISPLPHTAILLGAVLDIPLGGDASTKFTGADAPTDEDQNYDLSFGNYGVVGGLALFL
jgi:hypothetical protein